MGASYTRFAQRLFDAVRLDVCARIVLARAGSEHVAIHYMLHFEVQ